MYLFYLTLKTLNGMISLCILLYTIFLAVLSPILRRKNKKILLSVLCVLPLVCMILHFGIYGVMSFSKFQYLYLASLVPLLFLLPGTSKYWTISRSAVSSAAGLALCVTFLIGAISSSCVHNLSRYSYSESFRKMLTILEREYCLSSWKRIDYDALLRDYLPRVREAEKMNDETAYAAIISEVTYRFYDSHLNADLSSETRYAVCDLAAGNDYGLSMIRSDDGSVIAVLVDPDSEISKLGIHDGTVILAWDGQEINEAVGNTECIYPTIQFPVRSNEDIFRPVFLAGKGGDSVDITFLDDSCNEKTVSVQATGNYADRLTWAYVVLLNYDMERRNYYTCMLDDKCGYLQMTSEEYEPAKDYIAVIRGGYYPELTEYYAGLIGALRSQGMEYLVIDIRNNTGGMDEVAGALASLFTDEKKHMVSFGYEDSDGYHNKDDLYIFPDGRYRDLPVVVLTNAKCMSAGDGMAAFLKDCDNVTLMGITSSTGVNQNTGGYIYLTDNICVRYPVFLSLSSDGEPLFDTDPTRDNKIPLDVTIPMTRERALEMFAYNSDAKDVELEYAVGFLEDQCEDKP